MSAPDFIGCGMEFRIHPTPDPELFRVTVADQASAEPQGTVLVTKPEGGAARAVDAYGFD